MAQTLQTQNAYESTVRGATHIQIEPSGPSVQRTRITQMQAHAREKVKWLAAQSPPTSHRGMLLPWVRRITREISLTILLIVKENWCPATTYRPPSKASFNYCVSWLGSPEHVRLLLVVAAVKPENFEDSARSIVDHCLTNVQNTAVVMSLMASLTHLVGSRALNNGPQPAHHALPAIMFQVAYLFNAMAESASITTLAYAMFVRRALGSRLFSRESAIEWLLETKPDRFLMLGTETVVSTFGISVCLGAWVIYPVYGMFMVVSITLMGHLLTGQRARASNRAEELMYDDVVRIAALMGSEPPGSSISSAHD